MTGFNEARNNGLGCGLVFWKLGSDGWAGWMNGEFSADGQDHAGIWSFLFVVLRNDENH